MVQANYRPICKPITVTVPFVLGYQGHIIVTLILWTRPSMSVLTDVVDLDLNFDLEY